MSFSYGDDASLTIEEGEVRCHEGDWESSPFFRKFIVWDLGKELTLSVGAATVFGASSSRI